ncbi:MAG: aspartate aminotransferase family protein, partial [Gammaproteobacteria bacterium]
MQYKYTKNHLLNSYTPLPISFIKGNGVWLIDPNGNQYLDLIAGMGVTILGHSHPEITKVITNQANKLLHVSNLVEIPEQTILAKMLVDLTKLTNHPKEQPVKMFFTNSGAEAIETAIKLTRLFANFKNILDPKIIVISNGYHGRTLAALSASDQPAFKQGFEPLLNSFIHLELNNLEQLTYLGSSQNTLKPNIVAILLEPIQGVGGINLANHDFLIKIREICSKNQWLLIFDEIQTGLGRTGKMFCYQHYNIQPDVLTIAKGLANGIPIGACIIKQPFADLFEPKSHGSTFGGNPLACATALKTLEILTKNKLWEQAHDLGQYFITKLKQKLTSDNILEIRGKGLMIGIELNKPIPDLMLYGLQQKLLFNVTRDKIIRLLPPLIIKKSEIDISVEKIILIL